MLSICVSESVIYCAFGSRVSACGFLYEGLSLGTEILANRS